MTMKWDDLRVFLAVARRRAAAWSAGRLLGLDPATVGRRIGALEEALGAKLFDRSPQGYALTEAGRSLLDHAQAMESGARRRPRRSAASPTGCRARCGSARRTGCRTTC